MRWLSDFIHHDYFSGGASPEVVYDYHLRLIRMVGTLTIVLIVTYAFFEPKRAINALKISTNINGIPYRQYDLMSERNHVDIKNFAAKVLRQTFNLDSFGAYRGYVSTINFVNARHYRLSWEMMNLTDQEYQSGRVFDGETSYYLKGQELAAILVRSGIFKLLKDKEIKLWIELKSEDIRVTKSDACDPNFCKEQARVWDIEARTMLHMVELDGPSEVRVLPLKLSSRVIAVNRMVSPIDGLMIERLSATIPKEQQNQ